MGAFVKRGILVFLLLVAVSCIEVTNKRFQDESREFYAAGMSAAGRRRLTQSVCPDGSTPTSYRCGCDLLTAEQHAAVQRVSVNDAIQCSPVCGADDPSACDDASTTGQDCSQYVCVYQNCGAIELGGADVEVIRGGCEENQEAGWHVCRGGFTADARTVETVSRGVCAPACGQPQLSCQFPARFGPPIFPSPSVNETEIEDEEAPEVESNCEGGATPDGYVCSCEVVSAREAGHLQEALVGQETACVGYCGSPDTLLRRCRRRTCDTDVCIGPRADVMCAAFVPRPFVAAIQSFNCEPSRARGTVQCTKGNNFLEVDEPSYDTITNGVCFSGCGLERAQTRCRFNPVFRRAFIEEETASAPAPDSAVAPASEVSTPSPSVESPSSEAPGSEPDASVPEPSAAEPSASEPSAAEPSASEPSAAEPSASEPSAAEPSASEPSAPASEPDAPGSEPEEAPASEPDVPGSEPDEAPSSEPDEAPESEPDEAPYSEPDEAPGSEPDEAPYSEPDEAPYSEPDEAPYSEPDEAPYSEPDEAPYSEPDEAPESGPGEAPESEIDTPGSQPEDLCKTLLEVHGLRFVDEDEFEDIFNVMGDLPEECVRPRAPASAPASEPSLEMESAIEPEAEASEPEDMEEIPMEEPVAPPSEASMEEIDQPAIPPETRDTDLPDPVEVTTRITGGSVYTGPWGNCSQVCSQATETETGTRERTVLCVSQYGFPLPEDQCDPEEFNEPVAVEECEIGDCAGDLYFILSDWSECSKGCADYNEETRELDPGVQTRTATCFNQDGDEVRGRECEVAVLQRVALEQECNSSPCELVWYRTERWGGCDCETRSQTRSVVCVGLNSNDELPETRCEALGITPPTRRRSCRPPARCPAPRIGRKLLQADSDDRCQNVTCSTKGDCINGVCQCDEGFEGIDCQQEVRDNPDCPAPGLLDPEGGCCRSGVFALVDYECCEGENDEVQLDKDGNCCDGPLDMCGQCKGTGVLDALGRCCEGRLDGDGLCCLSNAIDECGVCDGDGSSCLTEFSLTLEESNNRNRRRCREPLADFIGETISPEEPRNVTFERESRIGDTGSYRAEFIAFNVSQSSRELEGAFPFPSLDFRNDEPDCNFTGLEITKRPLCGNGVCEIGESTGDSSNGSDTACREDCRFDFNFCELDFGFIPSTVVACSGHGRCLYADGGKCDCFRGYMGRKCNQCAPGFYTLSNSRTRCFPRQNFQAFVVDPEELPEGEGPGGNETTPEGASPTRERETTREFREPGNVITNQQSDNGLEGWMIGFIIASILILLMLLTAFGYYAARKRSKEATGSAPHKMSDEPKSSSEQKSSQPVKSEHSIWSNFQNMLANPETSRPRKLPVGSADKPLHDSPGASSRSLKEHGHNNSDEEVVGESVPLAERSRGLAGDIVSSKSSIASPTSSNPNTEKRSRLWDVKKWDSRNFSIRRKSRDSQGSASSLLGEDNERIPGPPPALDEGGTSTAVERLDYGMTPIEEGHDDRETQATSTQIHGAPSDAPRTAGSRESESD